MLNSGCWYNNTLPRNCQPRDTHTSHFITNWKDLIILYCTLHSLVFLFRVVFTISSSPHTANRRDQSSRSPNLRCTGPAADVLESNHTCNSSKQSPSFLHTPTTPQQFEFDPGTAKNSFPREIGPQSCDPSKRIPRSCSRASVGQPR